jgi:hypothetical protein
VLESRLKFFRRTITVGEAFHVSSNWEELGDGVTAIELLAKVLGLVEGRHVVKDAQIDLGLCGDNQLHAATAGAGTGTFQRGVGRNGRNFPHW